jgi:hypothetical protein
VGVLEASGGALELRDRLAQTLEAGAAALDEPATSARLADGAWGVEPARGGQQRVGLGSASSGSPRRRRKSAMRSQPSQLVSPPSGRRRRLRASSASANAPW